MGGDFFVDALIHRCDGRRGMETTLFRLEQNVIEQNVGNAEQSGLSVSLQDHSDGLNDVRVQQIIQIDH